MGSYVLFMVIADETDEAARAKWERYKDGADDEALSWLTEQSQKDTRSGADTNVRQMADRPLPSISTWARSSAQAPALPECSTKWPPFPARGRRSADLRRFHRCGDLRRAHSAADAVPRPHSCHHQGGGVMTTLNARPEAITFSALQSALIVVDMQNAYASPGGYLIWRGLTSPPPGR